MFTLFLAVKLNWLANNLRTDRNECKVASSVMLTLHFSSYWHNNHAHDETQSNRWINPSLMYWHKCIIGEQADLVSLYPLKKMFRQLRVHTQYLINWHLLPDYHRLITKMLVLPLTSPTYLCDPYYDQSGPEIHLTGGGCPGATLHQHWTLESITREDPTQLNLQPSPNHNLVTQPRLLLATIRGWKEASVYTAHCRSSVTALIKAD